ncbi:carboxypeptidase regulatory-like domain-containing protein, partial [bacterium]|nr:carboxypeptidase regulatory-like domain-containing protein [bacterium]
MIARMIFFGLFLIFSAVSGFAEEGSGTITGKWITKEYGPMTGGQVLLFNKAKGPPPASHKYLRLPDQGTAIDQEGAFSVQLPAGRYYLVMRKRLDPSSAGPPLEGEPQYYARDKNGHPRDYGVKAGQTSNIGTIAKADAYRKNSLHTDGSTVLLGTVPDKQGQSAAY